MKQKKKVHQLRCSGELVLYTYPTRVVFLWVGLMISMYLKPLYDYKSLKSIILKKKMNSLSAMQTHFYVCNFWSLKLITFLQRNILRPIVVYVVWSCNYINWPELMWRFNYVLAANSIFVCIFELLNYILIIIMVHRFY